MTSILWGVFQSLPLTWRLGLIGLALLGVGGTVSGLYFKVRHNGYAACLADIDRQNQEAINAGAAAADNVDKCVAAGGVWDTTTGQCSRR